MDVDPSNVRVTCSRGTRESIETFMLQTCSTPGWSELKSGRVSTCSGTSGKLLSTCKASRWSGGPMWGFMITSFSEEKKPLSLNFSRKIHRYYAISPDESVNLKKIREVCSKEQEVLNHQNMSAWRHKKSANWILIKGRYELCVPIHKRVNWNYR